MGLSFSTSLSLLRFGTFTCPSLFGGTAGRSWNAQETSSSKRLKIARPSSANLFISCMRSLRRGMVWQSEQWGLTTVQRQQYRTQISSRCLRSISPKLPQTSVFQPRGQYTSGRSRCYQTRRPQRCVNGSRRWSGSLGRLIGLGRFTPTQVNFAIHGLSRSSGRSGTHLRVSHGNSTQLTSSRHWIRGHLPRDAADQAGGASFFQYRDIVHRRSSCCCAERDGETDGYRQRDGSRCRRSDGCGGEGGCWWADRRTRFRRVDAQEPECCDGWSRGGGGWWCGEPGCYSDG